jgi:pSer/pThr/pTyr-binding forkhead associated (FHA) protein
MELKLVVLAGAKEGVEIPLKKDKFLIGRAKECSVRAGSEAISRRHCAIIRVKDRWAIRDLGSRNGTYVNDKRITEPVRLKPGDELRVGPLKFRVASVAAAEAAKTIPDSDQAPVQQSKPRKQPPVKNVADVVERTIQNKQADDSASEEDISRWLLGLPDPNGAETLKETRTIRLEETKTHKRASAPAAEISTTVEDLSEAPEASSDASDDSSAEQSKSAEDEAESAEPEAKSGGWNLFRRGKGAAKQKPGKLPPRPDQPTKDSREAAADILREMQRRR